MRSTGRRQWKPLNGRHESHQMEAIKWMRSNKLDDHIRRHKSSVVHRTLNAALSSNRLNRLNGSNLSNRSIDHSESLIGIQKTKKFSNLNYIALTKRNSENKNQPKEIAFCHRCESVQLVRGDEVLVRSVEPNCWIELSNRIVESNCWTEVLNWSAEVIVRSVEQHSKWSQRSIQLRFGGDCGLERVAGDH